MLKRIKSDIQIEIVNTTNPTKPRNIVADEDKKFREKRAKLRSRKGKIKGINLIHTLDNYAETGPEYTKIIAKMMEQNSLEDFENVRLTNSVEKKELNL